MSGDEHIDGVTTQANEETKLAEPHAVVKAQPIVAPATYADLPDIATCELLAFPGIESRIGANLFPFRAPLYEAGIHPRYWPDFQSTVRRRARKLGTNSELFKATLEDDGKKVVVGMAWFSPAPSLMRAKQTWNQRILNDYVYPAIDTVRNKIWSDYDGMNVEFVTMFKAALASGRKEYQAEHGEVCVLELLAVHPKYQRRGIGAALLERCISIADSARLPVYLEATEAGRPLYERYGFAVVKTLSIFYKGEEMTLPLMVRKPVSG